MGTYSFKAGDRVQLHPATDWWMRGAKYAEVVKVPTRGTAGYYVKLDVNGRVIRIAGRDLMEVAQ